MAARSVERVLRATRFGPYHPYRARLGERAYHRGLSAWSQALRPAILAAGAVGHWAVDAWDSAHFGVTMAKASTWASPPNYRAAVAAHRRVLATLIRACHRERVGYVTIDYDVSDRAGCHAASAHGFDVFDSMVTFAGRLPKGQRARTPGYRFELAGARDAAEIGRLAGRTIAYSRFHAEPRFTRRAAETFWARSTANACRGRADAVLVARPAAGGAVGFVSVFLDDAASDEFGLRLATIGLIGVDAAHRGRGLGRRLLQEAWAWLDGRAEFLQAGTQLENRDGVQLYQANGFSLVDAYYRMRRWNP